MDNTHQLISTVSPFLAIHHIMVDARNIVVKPRNNGMGIYNTLLNVRNDSLGVCNIAMNVRNYHICVYHKFSLEVDGQG